MMNTKEKESVEVTEEETNEYENATLEEKVEAITFWVQDSISEILRVLEEFRDDYYEPDPEGEKTSMTKSFDQIQLAVEEIGKINSTLEAL